MIKVERKIIDKILGYAIAACVSFLMILLFASLIASEFTKKSPAEQEKILLEQRKQFERAIALQRENKNLPSIWPPKMNAPYPDIELFDQKGQSFRTSQLAGRIIIIEYVDMSSPISQAQSGAKEKGAFGVMQEVDKLASPFQEALKQTTRKQMPWPHKEVIELKIIVYTQDGDQPSRDDAQNWAEHFGFAKENNVIVAIPKNDLRDIKTQDLVTGFQLVDKNMNLRVDSSGIEPKHNLRLTLMPLFEKLLP